MNIRNMLIAALLGFLGSATSAELTSASQPPEARAKVGENAPQFELADYDGKKHSLKDLKGKYVVLEWFNNGCPFVKKHYESGNMQGLQKKYTGKDVAWLTIVSSAEGKQGFLTSEQAHKIHSDWKISSSAMLVDTSGTVGRLYGARTTPHMYVIDPEGKLIYAGAIDNNDSSDQDDIPTSTNYVAMALDEAMAGKKVSTASTEPYGCSVKYKG